MAKAHGAAQSLVTRLTLWYVALALGLIAIVGGASTVFAFLNYANGVNASIASDTERVVRDARAASAQGRSLSAMAPALYADVKRTRRRVVVDAADGRRLYGDPAPSPRPRVIAAIATLIGLHGTRIAVPGGQVFVAPEAIELSRTLRSYWELMLPIGLAALAAAWFFGRAISRRAVAPLGQVTEALRRLGAGDLAPGAVTHADRDEIGELAAAYNGAVAHVQAVLGDRDRSEAEMRQFIADAGHELRTPLTVILGYLDLLEAGAISEPPVAVRVYDSMRHQGTRMRGLVDKLVLLARLEQPLRARGERVDVALVAQDVVDAMQSTSGAEGRLHLATGGDTWVTADESEVYEALRNIVENALKHAPHSPVDVRVEADGRAVTVTVADRGPGMGDEERTHAFERFYRGASRGAIDGSGLGLAIAKRAVERAQGEIALTSAPGFGTTVVLRLPVVPAGSAIVATE
ncbi:MAG: HAMP domain-containing sensor histidine kinase [Candidatus Baltobacteraceae bacterium]